LYALIDSNDINHSNAKEFYEGVVGKESLALSLPVLTEAWLLIEARLGEHLANSLWQSVSEGVFELLELDLNDLSRAREIDRRYSKARFGLVDATCFALCEKHKIRKVFTYDRRDFSIYRPKFSQSLELLPAL
jgi:predicted nucleic acid-binding protein